MISYSKLGAKVWTLVEQRRTSFLDNEKPWVQEIERLDAEIIAWYARVPPEVQIRDWHEEGHINSTSSYNLQRLRVWTYLRKNQVSTGLMTSVAFTKRGSRYETGCMRQFYTLPTRSWAHRILLKYAST